MARCRVRVMGVALMVMGLTTGACSFDPQSGEFRPGDDSGWEFEDPGDAGDTGAPDADGSEPDADELDADRPDTGAPDVDVNDPDTELPDANLPDADVPDADLPDADLPDADLPDADLPDADLPDADLPDADLPDADLPDTGDPGTDICDGAEVDLATDPENCGACGNACDGDFGVCNGGQCDCPGDMEACGTDNACREVLRDADNCGACGQSCGAGAFCDLGQCACRPGYTLCGGECVDTESDVRHCGACDTNCGFGHCKEGACASGGCGFGWIECTQGDGLSCLPATRPVHALYCGPRPFQGEPCGDVCEGSEVCALSFQGTQCRDVRPARDCLNCPCDDCGDDERCRDDIESLSPGAYCVSR